MKEDIITRFEAKGRGVPKIFHGIIQSLTRLSNVSIRMFSFSHSKTVFVVERMQKVVLIHDDLFGSYSAKEDVIEHIGNPRRLLIINLEHRLNDHRHIRASWAGFALDAINYLGLEDKKETVVLRKKIEQEVKKANIKLFTEHLGLDELLYQTYYALDLFEVIDELRDGEQAEKLLKKAIEIAVEVNFTNFFENSTMATPKRLKDTLNALTAYDEEVKAWCSKHQYRDIIFSKEVKEHIGYIARNRRIGAGFKKLVARDMRVDCAQ